VDPSHRLLYVVNVSWFFLSHRLPLAVEARRRGYDVHLATHVSSAADHAAIETAGIVLHELEVRRSDQSVTGNVGLFISLWRLYRKVQPDLVHHVTLKPVLLGGLAARLARVPAVIAAVPGLGFSFVARGAWAAIRRRLVLGGLRLALRPRRGRVIFQNAEDMDLLVGSGCVRSGDARLIPGAGVDVARFRSAAEPTGRVRVLLAARMLREKGIECFVAAADLLRQRGLDAEFLLAGEPDPGNPGSLSPTQLHEWSTAGCVTWLGRIDDMAELMRGVHIVCLPSYYGEGVPKVLIEAAAAGRPIVTTDTPGCRDIVRANVNGLLVPPRQPQALADALEQLIGDPNRRMRLGTAGRQLVESSFSLDRVVADTMAVYAELQPP
jgi:glycosyltransferase involved in cell wall biosynthesis